ncbi:hypothetical protein NHP21005_19730 (plasmid) [Helicobacter sp. NHP21005]|uniref:DUF2779 domain-containing protein n=1 Tax=Helicobacter felistomachi TaxID=3040201 RepID=UPI0025729033|nr:DUF2779 domain-containing protein [Helicobacter sp. NHP21005]BEG58285.1 hypothetical protein NHP21005_19730 [Helicobacter sp. NHP21005]
MHLSKSKFLKGMQCPKMLWLEKHKKEVLQTDAGFLAKAQIGQDVGQLARKLFHKGVEVVFNAENMASMAKHTKELIDQGVKTIYEATFEYQGIFVMVDILEIEGNGVVLNEVKSSTSAFEDTKKIKPKEAYLWDLGIQYYVLKGLGYDIKGAFLICLNNAYIREDALEPEKLFLKEDLLEFVKDFQSKVPEHLESMRQTLESNQEPAIDIGAHCGNPYPCDAEVYCWQEQRGITGQDHVFTIARLRFDQKMQFYRSGRVFFKDFNQEDLQELKPKQVLQITSTLNKKVHIDREGIKEFLAQLEYPIYHLDFETIQPAIPPFTDTKPYGKIPFQYSLHIESENGKLEHKEFLADCGTDGRLALAQQLIKDIPSGACVLAYNAAFEKSVLQDLANLLANKHPKIAEALLQIKEDMLDLMQPFQRGHYYDPKMGGSYSIKNVLPALVPDFENAYKNLKLVHNGEEAMEAYAQMPGMPKEEQDKYKKALLEYCKLDTLAMVKVLGVLRGT